MRFLFKIWMIFAAAAVIYGCSKEEPYTETSSQKESAETVYLRLRMDIVGGGRPDNSRRGVSRAATEEEPQRTPGTEKENVVRTVDLLVYDYDAENDKSGKLIDIISLDRTQIDRLGGKGTAAGSETEENQGAIIPLYATTGQKVHIYAAVNLTDKMRHRFALGQIGTDVSASAGENETNYCSIMDEFVLNSHGRQEKLEESTDGCIPMTGQFKVDNRTDLGFIIPIGDEMKNKANALNITAKVSRITAKILVLANATEEFTLSNGEKATYVFAEDKTAEQPTAGTGTAGNDEFKNWMGWIRLSNVRYMPNGINKSTYIIPQWTSDSRPMDLNMNLNDYVLSGTGHDLKFKSDIQERDFCFYNSVPLHKWNINPPHEGPAESGGPTSGMANAEGLNQTKLDNTLTGGDGERYEKGMYCLENYFDTPQEQDYSAFDGYEDAIPMVTHVSVAAKLTPRIIVVVSDFKERMDQLVKDFEGTDEYFFNKYKINKTAFEKGEIDRWKTDGEKKGIDRYFPDSGDENTEPYPVIHYPNKSFLLINTDTEADATDIINWSLKANGLWSSDPNDFEHDRYPAGTFYVFDMADKPSMSVLSGTVWNQRHLFFTAGAVASAKGEDFYLKAYSVPHLGGWGYYYTYIETPECPETGRTMAGYAKSQVERNTYYILTVNNFSSPGGLGTSPEYIKVNTEAVGWDYAGRGDITLH